MRARRAGEIGPVRLPPAAHHDLVPGRWYVDGMVQPAVPRRRHGRGFRGAVVDHPAPFEAETLVDLATLGPEVAVAEFVIAHVLAVEPGPELGPERLALPPSEEAGEKRFHRAHRSIIAAYMAPHAREVQRAAAP